MTQMNAPKDTGNATRGGGTRDRTETAQTRAALAVWDSEGGACPGAPARPASTPPASAAACWSAPTISLSAMRGAEAVLQQRVLDSIVRDSPDHFYLYDRAGRHLYANPSAALARGIHQADFIGKTWQDLGFSADTMLLLDMQRENVFATGRPGCGEIGFPSADRIHSTVHEYVLSPVRDADHHITSVMASLRDVSERKQTEESLRYLVLHDSLTGLPNRTLLNDRLQQGIFAAQRYHASLVVLLMDLDQFKYVNDAFGHAVGDLLLQQVGPRWQGVLRTTDTLARLGGDEFVALLPGTDCEGAQGVVEKLSLSTTEGFAIGQVTAVLSVSIGIAVYPEDGTDVGTLLHAADDAMYAMKTRRGGRTRHTTPV